MDLTTLRCRIGERSLFVSASLWLWVLGVVLLPVYVVANGRPQPSHLVLAAAIVASQIEFRRYDARYRRLVQALGLLVLVIAVVTLAWSLFAPSDVTLMPPIFVLFNFLVVRTALVLYSNLGERFLRATAVALAFAIAGAVLATFVVEDPGGYRSTGMFNNPNQLSFFALTAASAIAAIGLKKATNWRLQFSAYLGAAYLVAASNSKAGIVAFGVAVVLVAVVNTRLALAVAIALVILVSATQVGTTTYENVQARFSVWQNDDSLEARGYLLLTEHPEYIVMGAAEGYEERFGQHMEIHSTLGTVAFAYGIAGIAAFGAIFVQLFKISGWAGLAIVAPALVYGLTHNGLRFTPFWILVAVAATIGLNAAGRRAPVGSAHERAITLAKTEGLPDPSGIRPASLPECSDPAVASRSSAEDSAGAVVGGTAHAHASNRDDIRFSGDNGGSWAGPASITAAMKSNSPETDLRGRFIGGGSRSFQNGVPIPGFVLVSWSQ